MKKQVKSLFDRSLFLHYKKIYMPKIVKKSEETSNMVRQLSGLGLPQEQICSILDITRPTLTKHYEKELSVGKAQANAKVTENLFKIATGNSRGNVTACIFWLKTQCKWRETEVLEINNMSEQNDKLKAVVETIRATKLPKKDISKSTL